jgi:hypothetical protein
MEEADWVKKSPVRHRLYRVVGIVVGIEALPVILLLFVFNLGLN